VALAQIHVHQHTARVVADALLHIVAAKHTELASLSVQK
jgi:hypothetical protein